MPDQTNAEVSDERLRYAGDKAKAVGWTLDPDYLDKINREILEETGYDTTIEVIEAALLRGARSVTSQASEGAALDALLSQIEPRGILDDDDPDGYLVSDNDWVRANLRAVVAVMEAVTDPLYASPSKRVERLETVEPKTFDEWSEEDGDVVWWCWRDGEWLGEAAWIGGPARPRADRRSRASQQPRRVRSPASGRRLARLSHALDSAPYAAPSPPGRPLMTTLDQVRAGYETWAAKPHNAKWVKRLDGTPIANDIVVCIFDALSSLPAQAVGVKAPNLDQVRLRFFRDMTALERRKVYEAFGWPVEEIRTHAVERILFDRMFGALAPSQPAAVGVTDEMIGRAIDAWHADKQRTFASTPKSSMRAALEAALRSTP